ncbi:MAG: hypothetical protein ABI577_19225, partial [bacterium]
NKHMVRKLKSPRRLAALAIFAVVAMSAFGFAAANTFPSGAGTAGDGQAGVSGGAVTNVQYAVSGTTITGVEFDYSTTAANVRVALKDQVSGGNTLDTANTANCTIAASHFDCTFPTGAPVSAVNGLQVTTWN